MLTKSGPARKPRTAPHFGVRQTIDNNVIAALVQRSCAGRGGNSPALLFLRRKTALTDRPPSAPRTSAPASSHPRLQKTLLLWHVVIIGLAYIQPMTLLDTFGMVSRDSLQHVPASYFVALLAVLLTSLSYGHMIRRYPSSGSAYTYAQKAIHPNVGFMVGWSSLLDYLLSPMVNILLAKIYLTAIFPEVNHWFWIVGLTAVMVLVNLRGIRFVAHFNGLIVFFQLLIIAIFTFMVWRDLHAGHNALGPIAEHGGNSLWNLSPFW